MREKQKKAENGSPAKFFKPCELRCKRRLYRCSGSFPWQRLSWIFAKKRSIELEHVAIDAEIRHKEGLEFFFHFVHIIPRNFFETKIEKNNKWVVKIITKATYSPKLGTKCTHLGVFRLFRAKMLDGRRRTGLNGQNRPKKNRLAQTSSALNSSRGVHLRQRNGANHYGLAR